MFQNNTEKVSLKQHFLLFLFLLTKFNFKLVFKVSHEISSGIFEKITIAVKYFDVVKQRQF